MKSKKVLQKENVLHLLLSILHLHGTIDEGQFAGPLHSKPTAVLPEHQWQFQSCATFGTTLTMLLKPRSRAAELARHLASLEAKLHNFNGNPDFNPRWRLASTSSKAPIQLATMPQEVWRSPWRRTPWRGLASPWRSRTRSSSRNHPVLSTNLEPNWCEHLTRSFREIWRQGEEK